jgi:hypothetical protein
MMVSCLHCKRAKFSRRAQTSVNANGLTEKLMTEKYQGIAMKSHFSVIILSVSRILRIDAAVFWISSTEREFFIPQFITRPLDQIRKEAGYKLGVKNGLFRSLVAASPRWAIRVPLRPG